jgi:adenosylhomocysteine nucleosidase
VSAASRLVSTLREPMLFIAAEAREFDGLLPFCSQMRKLPWPLTWARSAILNGRTVFLAANGAGPRNAAQAVEVARLEMPHKSTDAVVSTGFCGAVDPALKIGDVFVATSIQVAGELAPALAPQCHRRHYRGTLVSMDRVAQTAQEKRDLCSAGASAVEMEAAGVLSRVREWGMPFYCIRSVTDLASESFHVDFNAVRTPDGRFSTPRILAAAIASPITIAPELIELRRRCATAAQSLGEFIADCSF